MSQPVDDILEHYGTKGMKWGVKKSGDISSAVSKGDSKLRRPTTDVSVRQAPGKFVKTSGGKRQTAADDAVKVAAARQLAKKSTTDALSNKQLQDAVTRMNLETQFTKLAKQADRRSRGQKFIAKLTGDKKSRDMTAANVEKAARVADAMRKTKSATKTTAKVVATAAIA